MADETDALRYASSPCMAHEAESFTPARSDIDAEPEAHEFNIIYLYVEEGGPGYRWQVREHNEPDPLACSRNLFSSAAQACEAGRPVLDRICSQFDRYRRPGS